METREKMKLFIDELGLTQQGVADIMGVHYSALNRYLQGIEYINTAYVDAKCESFMTGYGLKLLAINKALRNGAKNRIELHRRRSAILSKVKVHEPAKQCEPSVVNS